MRAVTRVLAAAALLSSASAWAGVIQPDGTAIPANPYNLNGYLNGSSNNDGINEGIDSVRDGATEPQKFAPQCTFSGKYIAKGGGANFAIGWYNVDDTRASTNPPRYVPVDTGANLNTPAAASDIQILFPFASTLPSQRDLSSATIRQHPSYKGGLIGFVLVPNPNGTGSGNATQYHYTEHRFNTQCTQCTNPGPWYSTLTYRSSQLPNTFYLGFEDLDFLDLPGSQGTNGNDLDYEDFLFRFSGLTCASAGSPCEVSTAVGACRQGVTDCDTQGQTVCRALIQPGTDTERCDGVDNDCDGTVDDGAACPTGQICDRGQCVERCGTGEIGKKCTTGFTCTSGVCVEDSCVGKGCPTGQICRAGTCGDACAGVVCPYGQQCRGGRCLDPCAGVTCQQGQVCLGGACVTGCGCSSCPSGETCVASTQKCTPTACATVTCAAGKHCSGGTCVDDCTGVVCPRGEKCTGGACVFDPTQFAGPDAGAVEPPDASDDGGGLNLPPDTQADGGGKAPGDENIDLPSGGCGCASAKGVDVAALLLAAAGLLGLARGNLRRRS